MAIWTELTVPYSKELEMKHGFSLKKWCKDKQDTIGSEINCELLRNDNSQVEYYIRIDEELSSPRMNEFIDSFFKETPLSQINVISGLITSPLSSK